MLGLALWVIGEIVQSSSYSFGQLIAGRAIAGFGTHDRLHSQIGVRFADAKRQAMASLQQLCPPTKLSA